MTVQDIHIKKYDWVVRAFYNVKEYDNLIIESLKDIGCKGAYGVFEEFIDAGINSGFIYSAPMYKSSVIVVGMASSPEQFQNTFDHEKGHLAMHIAESEGIDLLGEEFQHLVGSIGELMYPAAKKYICDC